MQCKVDGCTNEAEKWGYCEECLEEITENDLDNEDMYDHYDGEETEGE